MDRDDTVTRKHGNGVATDASTTQPVRSTPRTGLKTSAMAEAGGKKGHSCKPLPTRFRRNGFDYRQIARDGELAIYETSWGGCADPSVCFEVIRIRQRPGFEINGRFVGPAEVYPNSEVWGSDGFTITGKEAAFRKLREVVSQKAEPPC